MRNSKKNIQTRISTSSCCRFSAHTTHWLLLLFCIDFIANISLTSSDILSTWTLCQFDGISSGRSRRKSSKKFIIVISILKTSSAISYAINNDFPGDGLTNLCGRRIYHRQSTQRWRWRRWAAVVLDEKNWNTTKMAKKQNKKLPSASLSHSRREKSFYKIRKNCRL